MVFLKSDKPAPLGCWALKEKGEVELGYEILTQPAYVKATESCHVLEVPKGLLKEGMCVLVPSIHSSFKCELTLTVDLVATYVEGAMKLEKKEGDELPNPLRLGKGGGGGREGAQKKAKRGTKVSKTTKSKVSGIGAMGAGFGAAKKGLDGLGDMYANL